jgi:hypothetical protein
MPNSLTKIIPSPLSLLSQATSAGSEYADIKFFHKQFSGAPGAGHVTHSLINPFLAVTALRGFV